MTIFKTMTIRTDIFLCFSSKSKKKANIIHPKSGNKPLARYTVEDLVQWGQSFKALIASPDGRKLFRDFLKTEYSHENIMFYEACLELDVLEEEDEIFDKVRNIYEDYISTLSPREVSLDSQIRDDILVKMISPDKRIFDKAREHIYNLMFRDSYPRFKNSDVYKKALDAHRRV